MSEKPVGMEELECPRVTIPAQMHAHGGHVWDGYPDQDDYWCPGLAAHPNTMIGR